MFPLPGTSVPASHDGLAASLEAALKQFLSFPSAKSPVVVQGGNYPEIALFRIDLTSARIIEKPLPPKPRLTGESQPGIRADHLQLIGTPLYYQGSPLNLTLDAHSVRFDFGHDQTGALLLILAGAERGQISLDVSQADLQAILLAAVSALAKGKGVVIQDLRLRLEGEGTRGITISLRLKAKKMIASGVVHLNGRVDIDDSLNARLSGLTCSGEGIIGKMTAGMIQSHLTHLEGTNVPLLAMSRGNVALKDINIQVGESVHLDAAFGDAAA